MPIQPKAASNIRGSIELLPEYVDGLRDLEGFSHIILLYHFHVAGESQLIVVPFLDTERRGIFATRAPIRPNPIGLSVVKLIGLAGNNLEIEGIDVVDGTPLLDIKPYVPMFDHYKWTRIGWLEKHKAAIETKKSNGRFK